MAWITPKTDWTPPDGVADSDFNRIEGNILDVKGRVDGHDTAIGNLQTAVYTDLSNYQRKVRLGGLG